MCNQICTLIIDTGADISIFKREKISDDQLCYTDYKCTIQGVTSTQTQTLGATFTKLKFNDQLAVEHSFQIVNNGLALDADGILGLDFLTKYKATIDYDTWTLNINVNDISITLPIFSGPTSNTISIPPRCEVIRKINILHGNTTDDLVISSKEVEPGIFISGALVSRNNPLIRILNTTSKAVTIKEPRVAAEPLTDFHILSTKFKDTERTNKVLSKLKFDHIPTYARTQVKEVCKQFQDIFALDSEALSTNNFYEQHIELADNRPVYTKNYRIPEIHKHEINRQVELMLKDGIIENSVSHFNSPILLVPKKSSDGNKKWRLVVDFRTLNKKVLADKFPLPRLEDILDQMGRAKYFSTLDLMSGFHQVPLEENSRKYTAFSTYQGHYQYTRLPFGLNISPNSFQRMINIAMAGLTPEIAFLYIDDIIVIGCSQAHHLKNLKAVFQRLRDKNLKLNPEKCQFFKTEVTYLGHRISAQGIKPDSSKYEAIEHYPIPKNSDDVRRFVAFCNYYRRFVPNFANIATPLNKLLRKNAKFEWLENHQVAFETLKNILMSPTILQHPDFSKEFIISTDASNEACGAILSQNFDGKELPIAYASKTFTPGEKNKSTIEKELTAIHWAVIYFRPYIYGRRFRVKSDHRPLAYLFGTKNPSSKLTRMRLDLEEFDFEIEYIKGKENTGPDALSRIKIDINDLKEINILQVKTRAMAKQANKDLASAQKEEIITTAPQPDQLRVMESLSPTKIEHLPELKLEICSYSPKLEINIVHRNKMIIKRNIRMTQQVEPALEQVFEILESDIYKQTQITKLRLSAESNIFEFINITAFKIMGNQGLKKLNIYIYKPQKYISDKAEIQEILYNFHATPTGGHIGQSRLFNKLKDLYKWQKMRKTIANYIAKCEVCAKNKHQKHHKETMQITTTPVKAFDIVSIDTVGPFTKTANGNRYAVTMQCDLTKYVVIVPTTDKEANTIAQALVNGFILTYGPMNKIKSDLGTEYKNQIFTEICNILKIKQLFATAAHPETIGALERNHKCLNEYLRCFVNDNKDDWDTWIPYYSFCYNTTPNTVHGYTPFELIFSKNICIPSELSTQQPEPMYNYDLYSKEMKFRLQKTLNKATEYLELSKCLRNEASQIVSNPSNLKIGDKVLITNVNRKKLDPLYKGPYTIIDVENVNCIIIDDYGNTQKIHKNRLKLLNIDKAM